VLNQVVFVMVGIDSEVLKFAIWGIVSTVFDNTFVLFRSVKTISVVIFRAMIFGILVNSCVVPVILAANPEGKDVVFRTFPSAECTFLTA
jgi:hypothetical protein